MMNYILENTGFMENLLVEGMKLKNYLSSTNILVMVLFWSDKVILLLVIIPFLFGNYNIIVNINYTLLIFLFYIRHQGKVNHCRIRSKHDKGQLKYYLIEGSVFDSLYSLITYYRSYPLRIHVSIYLKNWEGKLNVLLFQFSVFFFIIFLYVICKLW